MKNSTVFTMLCNPYLVPKPSHYPQRKPIKQLFLPPAPGKHCFPSLWICIFGTLRTNTITPRSLVWLASFTQHHIFKAHPHCSVYENFIPFHGWIGFQGMSMEYTWFPLLRRVLSLSPWSSVTRKFCCHYVFRPVLCTQRKVSPWSGSD